MVRQTLLSLCKLYGARIFICGRTNYCISIPSDPSSSFFILAPGPRQEWTYVDYVVEQTDLLS